MALRVPRCARCLQSMRARSKYCASCRRKMVGVTILAVAAIVAAAIWAYSFLLVSEPSPPIWIQ